MEYPKLTLIYRAYPGESFKTDIKDFRPGWFSKEACQNSIFKNFSGFPNCKIFGVWDGDPNNFLYDGMYENCDKLFPNKNNGNINSLLRCYEIAKECDSDFIFFVEDDFLFLPGSWEVLIDMLQYSPIVSLYDHFDRYRFAQTDITYGHEFIIDGMIPYRSAESTTQTFAVRKDFFIKYYDKFIEYALAGVESPLDRELFRFFVREGYRLITPILKDSKAAHLVNGCFTDKIDWEYYSNAYKN
jgi:hypothetical protein